MATEATDDPCIETLLKGQNDWASLPTTVRLARLEQLHKYLSQMDHHYGAAVVRDALDDAGASLAYTSSTLEVRTGGLSVVTEYQPYPLVGIFLVSPSVTDLVLHLIQPLLAGCAIFFLIEGPKSELENVVHVLESTPEIGVCDLVDGIPFSGDEDVRLKLIDKYERSGVHFLSQIRKVALVVGNGADLDASVDSLAAILRKRQEVVAYVCESVDSEFLKILDRRESSISPAKVVEGDALGMYQDVVRTVADMPAAVKVVASQRFDIAAIFDSEESAISMAKDMNVPKNLVNPYPRDIDMTAHGPPSIRQCLRARSVVRRERSLLELMKQYLVGRFDNSEQIKREKSSGEQRTAFAVHVNDVIDAKIEGAPNDGVFHILEETYKYAPGERNAIIRPLILRFEEVDGMVSMMSLQIPEGFDVASVRIDNPELWFGKGELKVSPNFPERQVYEFNSDRREFKLNAVVPLAPGVVFRLAETISSQRLTVYEHVRVGGVLKDGYYETPFLYDRIHEHRY